MLLRAAEGGHFLEAMAAVDCVDALERVANEAAIALEKVDHATRGVDGAMHALVCAGYDTAAAREASTQATDLAVELVAEVQRADRLVFELEAVPGRGGAAHVSLARHTRAELVKQSVEALDAAKLAAAREVDTAGLVARLAADVELASRVCADCVDAARRSAGVAAESLAVFNVAMQGYVAGVELLMEGIRTDSARATRAYRRLLEVAGEHYTPGVGAAAAAVCPPVLERRASKRSRADCSS